MIDPLVVKKTYGIMSNAELLSFAQNEGGNLTVEAFDILRTEFQRRDLPDDVLIRIEDGSYHQEQATVAKITRQMPEQSPSSALGIALNEKRDGLSDETIVFHLMEEGLDEFEARLVMTRLAPEAERLFKKANHALLISVFIFCAGLALELISPEKNFVTFLDIASTCTMIFGLLKFLKSWLDRSKYKRVIRNVSEPVAV